MNKRTSLMDRERLARYEDIRYLYEYWPFTTTEIAGMFGYTCRHISSIVRGFTNTKASVGAQYYGQRTETRGRNRYPGRRRQGVTYG